MAGKGQGELKSCDIASARTRTSGDKLPTTPHAAPRGRRPEGPGRTKARALTRARAPRGRRPA
eukprot:13290024-Alexandrium_andersonii.AAC.1